MPNSILFFSKHLVNFEDLTRILGPRSSFIRMVSFVPPIILGYTPISKIFQYSKHVIKCKHPWLARIDVVVPRFFSGSPLKGNRDVELTI